MLEINKKFPEVVLRINSLEEAKELLLALASLPDGEPDMVTLVEAKDQLTSLLKGYISHGELHGLLNPFPEEDEDDEDLLDDDEDLLDDDEDDDEDDEDDDEEEAKPCPQPTGGGLFGVTPRPVNTFGRVTNTHLVTRALVKNDRPEGLTCEQIAALLSPTLTSPSVRKAVNNLRNQRRVARVGEPHRPGRPTSPTYYRITEFGRRYYHLAEAAIKEAQRGETR